nr:olfactory receptor 2L5-like [Cavia porcellus]
MADNRNVNSRVEPHDFVKEDNPQECTMENYTQTSTDFILLGLLSPSMVGHVLFILIIPIFLMGLVGNLAMVLLILLDAHLHTPMYVLLGQLSVIDLMYICTTVPKIDSSFLSGNKSLSFIGCGVQAVFFVALASSEEFILMAKAYDCYVAISFPLHYPICMNTRVEGHQPFLLRCPSHVDPGLSRCQRQRVHCVLSIIIFLLIPFTIIMISCGNALLVVSCMCSLEGRKKAYSSHSSHLTMVTFYNISFAYTYLYPRSLHSPAQDKFLAVFYSILTPVLNFMIYSLRNRTRR